MLGRKEPSPPLLTISPEDLQTLQENTARIVDALQRATEDMRESMDKMAVATRELNRATVELRKAREKHRTIVRNTP